MKNCVDRNTEIEAICHFKLGRILLHLNKKKEMKLFNQAKNHLIDFQILSHDIVEKGISLQKKLKETKLMIRYINNQFKKHFAKMKP